YLGMLVTLFVATASPLQHPKFEVASIKRCDTAPGAGGPRGGGGGGGTGSMTVQRDRTRLECVTVKEVIHWAFYRYPDGQPLTVKVSQKLLNQAIEGS